MIAFLLITIGLYGLASLFYLIHLFERGDGLLRLARWALCGAVLIHLCMIGFLCQQQQNPVKDLRGALSLIAWLIAAGFLLTTVRVRIGVLGAFITPLALVLLAVSGFAPQDATWHGLHGTTKILGQLHIALSALGAAAFGLAAAVALIYLFQVSALKNKRLGTLFRRTPPLRILDTIGRRLILFGFLLFTLAMVTGVFWVSKLPDQQGIRLEYIISSITWLIFGALILLRVTVGLRGRRAAIFTVLGFATTISILLIYMVRRLWGA